MKKQVSALIASGLVLIGSACYKKPDQAASITINKVLGAHNTSQAPGGLARSVAVAAKTQYLYADSQGEPPVFAELEVRVCFDGDAFKREKRELQSRKEQVEISDGQVAFRSGIDGGRPNGSASELQDSQFEGVKFNVMTFGIIPLLRHLRNPSVDAVYLPGAEGGQEKIEVKIDSVVWTMYLGQDHLIRKVEMVHNKNFLVIEYGDYRPVDGLQLPFFQRVFDDGKPSYELVFSRYELNPSYPGDYFDLPNRGI